MTDPPSTVRLADASEFAELERLYREWGYGGGIGEADRVYVAQSGPDVVGLVRRTLEHGVTMLRGMQIRADHRRRKIGSLILTRFVADLEGAECYCLPFSHLMSFYGQAGFRVVDPHEAPAFIAERLAAYRSEGRDVLIMRRDRR